MPAQTCAACSKPSSKDSTLRSCTRCKTACCPSLLLRCSETLHQALQIASDWAHSHAHDFAVYDPGFEASADSPEASDQREFSLRIEPDEKRPQEWAVVMKKGNGVGSIDRVHEWRRRHPLTVEEFEHKHRVFQLLEDAAYGDTVIDYTYDFGDGWSHRMRQSSVASQPRVTSRVLKGLGMESGRT